jgi:hypothetical protein
MDAGSARKVREVNAGWVAERNGKGGRTLWHRVHATHVLAEERLEDGVKEVLARLDGRVAAVDHERADDGLHQVAYRLNRFRIG